MRYCPIDLTSLQHPIYSMHTALRHSRRVRRNSCALALPAGLGSPSARLLFWAVQSKAAGARRRALSGACLAVVSDATRVRRHTPSGDTRRSVVGRMWWRAQLGDTTVTHQRRTTAATASDSHSCAPLVSSTRTPRLFAFFFPATHHCHCPCIRLGDRVRARRHPSPNPFRGEPRPSPAPPRPGIARIGRPPSSRHQGCGVKAYVAPLLSSTLPPTLSPSSRGTRRPPRLYELWRRWRQVAAAPVVCVVAPGDDGAGGRRWRSFRWRPSTASAATATGGTGGVR